MRKGTCSIDECEKPVLGRGWCSMHYNRWRRNGDPLVAGVERESNARACKIDGCAALAAVRGWCSRHYSHFRNHGHPTEKRWSEKPCDHCGVMIMPKTSLQRYCKDCANHDAAATKYEVVKAWRKLNPEKVNAQARRRHKRSPEKFATATRRYRDRHGDRIRPIEAAQRRKRREADPAAEKRRQRKNWEKREAKLAADAGRPRALACELCFAPGKTVWDHCHRTGEFRGWICDRCNRVLGSVHDREDLLQAMIDYVNKDCRESGLLVSLPVPYVTSREGR